MIGDEKYRIIQDERNFVLETLKNKRGFKIDIHCSLNKDEIADATEAIKEFFIREFF